jgi:outer membrane protein assembly factor BamA
VLFRSTSGTTASSDWIALPILYYTPETKLAIAAGGLYFFRDGTDATQAHPSGIAATVEYTQRSQMQFELSPDIALLNGEYRLNGQIGFRKFPATYYRRVHDSLIEERYTPQTTYFRMSLQKSVAPNLTAGCTVTYSSERMATVEPGGVLESGELLGSRGGVTSGTGITLTLDDRDNSFFPSSGRYYEGSYTTYQKFAGSDYTFNRWKVDLRDYYSVGTSQVIALQRYAGIVTGDVPFQNLSVLGGKEMLRGYAEGSYRGKTMVAVQLDYRVTPVWWRLGFAAFASVGEVAESVDRLSLADMQYSAGFGVRYLLIEKEKLSLRFDWAWGKGSSGFYITINEAF